MQCPWFPLPPGPVPIPAQPAPSLKPLQRFCAAARNAIFFISVYKLPGFLSTTSDYPQGRWEFLPGQAFHLVSLSWSNRVAASQSICCCLGEPGLAQTQLFMFPKPYGNESLSSAEEAFLKFRIISLWCCASSDGQSCCSWILKGSICVAGAALVALA